MPRKTGKNIKKDGGNYNKEKKNLTGSKPVSELPFKLPYPGFQFHEFPLQVQYPFFHRRNFHRNFILLVVLRRG